MSDDIENEFDTEDFDTGDFDDGGFDDLDDQRGTLGDLWRNNPLVKIGVIVAAFAFLVGGVIIFGGKSDQLPISRVASGTDLTEAPGGENAAPKNFTDAVEEENIRRAEEAIRNNTSSIPTPVTVVKGNLPLQFEEPEEEDPLERWRRMQEDRIRQQQVEAQPVPGIAPAEPEVDTRTPAVNALAEAMSQQMNTLLSAQEINPPFHQEIATVAYLEGLQEKERQRLEAELAARNALIAEQTPVGSDITILLPAGTIEFAQLITEANTDSPGPILAQISSGPLRGGRLIGSFSSNRRNLTLNFNTIVIDGVDYAIEGIAIDPGTTLPAVATEYNGRYFTRVILPTAAEFLTGLTEAIANSGRTTIEIRNSDGSSSTTTEGVSGDNQEVASGLEAAGEELADILDEMADETEPLIRVAPGTSIGVLFLSAVVDTPQLIQQREAQDQQFLLNQQQFNGTNFNAGNIVAP